MTCPFSLVGVWAPTVRALLPFMVVGAAGLYALAAERAYRALGERRLTRPAGLAAWSAWTLHTLAFLGGALVGGVWSVWSAIPGAVVLITWLASSSHQASVALLNAGPGSGPARGTNSPALPSLAVFLYPAIAVGLVLAGSIAWWASGASVVGTDRAVLAEPWVPVHVALAALGSVLFTLAWIAGLMHATQDRSLRRLSLGPLSRHLPSLETLDRLTVQFAVGGLLFLAAGLVPAISRAIGLWGEVWITDPKVVATFTAILAYAGYLVARVTLGWTARRARWILTLGFVLTALNLLVAAPFLSRFHQWL